MTENRPSKYLDNKVKEQKEKEVSWRGSVGFDFIFVREGFDAEGKEILRPVCVELNGSNSGIGGIGKIDHKKIPFLERLFARMRGRENKKISKAVYQLNQFHTDFLNIHGKPISEDEMFESGSGFSQEAWGEVREYLDDIYRKASKLELFEEANINPPFLRQVCLNKNLQEEYIPEKNRAAQYVPESHTKSNTGFWIVKPVNGMQGKGIEIFSDQELEAYLKEEISLSYIGRVIRSVLSSDNKKIENYASIFALARTKFLQDYNISEMLNATGAQTASDEFRNNPASMRLLLDFTVTKKGEIVIEQGFGYQRVSSMKDAKIVNKATGAKSYPVSQLEMSLALPVAKEIIQNLNRRFDEITEEKTRVHETVEQDI